jgi:hypothetical protein
MCEKNGHLERWGIWGVPFPCVVGATADNEVEFYCK